MGIIVTAVNNQQQYKRNLIVVFFLLAYFPRIKLGALFIINYPDGNTVSNKESKTHNNSSFGVVFASPRPNLGAQLAIQPCR